jgi:hypothetical protein
MLRYELVPVLTWKWRGLLVVLCLVISGYAFFIWAPWTAAISPEECATKYGRVVPHEWRAVIVNHGQFSEFERGLPQDHLLAYYTYGIMDWGGGIALIFIIGRFRWEKRSKPIEAATSK